MLEEYRLLHYTLVVEVRIANTEIWNGSTWTEVNDLNDGRYVLKGGGTTTAAVLAGGYGGSPSTNPTQSEQWNGTSWTEGNNLN